jgi:hypothetical protein
MIKQLFHATAEHRSITNCDLLPKGNLVSSAGLPASPFRSDDWK